MLTGKSGVGKTQLVEALFAEKITATRKMSIDPEEIAWLPQHAEHSFNPLKKIYTQFEDIRLAQKRAKEAFFREVYNYITQLDLHPDVLRKYPFECSGGMLQRLQIILALCQRPKLIIADEPTAALDPTHAAQVLALWEELSNQGLTLLIITHQTEFYRSFASRFLLLKDGTLQKVTWHPSKRPLHVMNVKGPLCCFVEGSVKRECRSFWRTRIQTALTISAFSVYQGEIIGIRGESGSGKTTFLQALLGQLDIIGQVNLAKTQYVPQLFNASFPPHWLVQDIVLEAKNTSKCTEEYCLNLLQKLQLDTSLLKQQVHTLSGGQQQRLAMFRVLLQRPQLLLLDESFSSLDEETTIAITNILLKLVQDGLAIVCVSHDEQWLNHYTHRQYVIQENVLKEHSYEENMDNQLSCYFDASSM